MTRRQTTNLEADLNRVLAAAGFRLRFDKVVLRVLADMQDSLAGTLPSGDAVLFTLSAPIRQPAKTTALLVQRARHLTAPGEHRDTALGNHFVIRRVTGLRLEIPPVLGFVHNPMPDATAILNLAEARLRAERT